MKIKLLNNLILVNILTILLVLSIYFIPNTIVRIILGLPFLLFFPGYTLVSALFAKKETISNLERIALSFGMSIAITGLLGLGLNYTPWGIKLNPILITITSFIVLMSIIAFIRTKPFSLFNTYQINFPGWTGNAFNKTLTIVLIVAVIGSLGALGYAIAKPKTGERFSEFYILGATGKADSYPSDFRLSSGTVTEVSYNGGFSFEKANLGKVTLGIINQEHNKTVYTVAISINDQPVNITYAGTTFSRLESIDLQHGETWQQEIGFAPVMTGDNQKVEFRLLKGNDVQAEYTLHLWVNVRGQ